MADYGRDWLRHPHAARLGIVVGSRNVNGLKMFDPRMAWQVISSLFIVCGSVGGATILSCKRDLKIEAGLRVIAEEFVTDFTPTVGLGCRSGGYTVYMVIAVGLLIIETLVWWLTHETTHTSKDPLARMRTRLERHISREGKQEKNDITQARGQRLLSCLHSRTFRDIIKNFVLRPGE